MSPRPHSSEIHRVTQSEPRKGISFSRQFRFWVWVNIALQFFLPLMLAFTPAVRAAQVKWYQTPSEQQAVSASASELPTLGGSPAGDEKSGDESEKATETQAAQLASKTGQFLNNASGDAAAGIARQMATGKASAEIEQWLNRVGTARVKVQVDEEFSLKNSSVDLLIPWYDSPDTLLFSQHSLHRTDDRTQGNLGAGYRYYTPDWMAGVNAFYDYDFSGEHSRMGMGLEYGRDYLKLAANGYFRLSGWKDASDLADYEARPANGWDIRGEGYLPVYPQLGGKLVYEQYYGKEVGLFGRDNRQQDPRAVTAGLSYTPFPLMTLSADHRMGEGGENDTRLGVEFSWQFDTPLHKLLDTDAVGQMRTLAGSRYHLVDRNNNIVLEYREKNNLTLKMADALRGYQGDRLSLDVVVNARHGLERIVWDDSALRAAGGEVTCTANTQCVVTLPLWKTGGIDANTYVISAVAGLEQTKSLVADGGSYSYTRVVVTVKDANGHGVNGLQPTIAAQSGGGLLKNANGVSITEGTDFTMARGTEDGVYYLSVWAQTTSGTVKFSVTGGLNPGVIPAGQNNVTVNLTAGEQSVAGIYLSSETDGTGLEATKSLVANGSSYTRVVVKVEDANGNGVNGLRLKIAAQSGGGLLRNANNVSMTQGTDFDMVAGTEDGVYYLSVWAGTRTGTVTFSVTDGLNPGVLPAGSNNVTVNLTAGAPSVAGIYLSSEADGTALESTKSLVAVANSNFTRVVVTVKDANGNGVKGLEELKIAAQSGGGLLTSGGVSMTQGTDFDMIASDVEGVYYLNVWSGNTSGTVTFSVTGGLNPGVIPAGRNNVTVNLTAGDPSVAGIYLSSETNGTALTSTKSIVADGSSDTRVVVTVKDANGNGVNGLRLKIAAQSGGGLLTSGGVLMTQGTDFDMIASGVDGVYYRNVWSRKTAGTVTFSVTGGLNPGVIPAGSNNVTVNLTAGSPSSANTSIRLSSRTDGTALVTSTSMVANGSNETRVVVTVKDANGNPVKDLTDLRIKAGTGSLLKNTDGTLIVTGTEYALASTTDGVYYKTVKAGTKAGSVKFWVSYGLPGGTISDADNGVTVNLVADTPSSANTSIRLSSRTDGTALVTSTSLVANGSNETKVVVTVKDANGNPVKNLTDLRIKAGTDSLLKNTDGTLIVTGTEYALASTTDGVYYKTVKAGTTAGSVRFWVSYGLPGGTISSADNGVTVTLTTPPPATAQINAWWSYQGGSNGSTYREFSSAVRFLTSAGTPMQCDSVTVVGNGGTGFAANANTTMANRHTFAASYWSNDSSTFNANTKTYSFSKRTSVYQNGGAGNTFSVVLAASGQISYPVVGVGMLGGGDLLTFSCRVGSTTYSFKSSNNNMTVNSSLF
ncbi:TPA: hypothetical protein I8190_002884 [Citrobacter freundii]|nr:inverse autotransporter beta domain-containing protein [Citrobacter farmeri]HAT2286130.1 hypothetical protein [Citrobacter freundii]HAT2350124.1 hypothetical protein [Citrobacter freundii]HAT2430495.1 hypothetical protein [Citrobacter freundii]HAT2499006.1 hypothetical protein [Citrobacter freundii]